MPQRFFSAVWHGLDAVAGLLLSAVVAVASVAVDGDGLAVLGFPAIQILGLFAGAIADWGTRGAAYLELPEDRRRPYAQELRLRAFWGAVALVFGGLWAHYAIDWVVRNHPTHAAANGLISFVCVYLSMVAIDFMRAVRRAVQAVANRESTQRVLEGLVIGFVRRKAGLPPTPPPGGGDAGEGR